LHGQRGEVARARLSGFLIGAELAATRAWWLGQEIVIIGAGRLAGLYQRALASQGVPATQADAGRVTLAGLTAARHAAGEQA
jgi:2-dehydro-3-deoxygalactonokinase